MSTVTKRLNWALALSIGLNLFLLGFGGSHWFRMRAHPHAGHPPAAMLGHRHGPGLSRLLGPPTPELRGQRRALHEARNAVASALTAEPYQPEQLTRALAELRARTASSQEVLHRRLIELAKAMTPAQRRSLAETRFVRSGAEDPTGP